MAALSCLLLLLSVVYGAHSCDSNKIAIFTKNPLGLKFFEDTVLHYRAVSSNFFPNISSALLQLLTVTNGEADATAFLFRNQERFDSFDIKFIQTDGKPMTGRGFYKDQNALLTYYANECGKSHATYVCDEKDPSFEIFSVTCKEHDECSDEDFEQCLGIIQQAGDIQMMILTDPPV